MTKPVSVIKFKHWLDLIGVLSAYNPKGILEEVAAEMIKTCRIRLR